MPSINRTLSLPDLVKEKGDLTTAFLDSKLGNASLLIMFVRYRDGEGRSNTQLAIYPSNLSFMDGLIAFLQKYDEGKKGTDQIQLREMTDIPDSLNDITRVFSFQPSMNRKKLWPIIKEFIETLPAAPRKPRRGNSHSA